MNMFDKKLGKQLWERIKVFHGSSYISEESLTAGDAEVMQEIHLELADAKEYVAALEYFTRTFQIPFPLRHPRDEPLDLTNTQAFADLAQRVNDAAGTNWRQCYAEDVPRLLALLEQEKRSKHQIRSKLLNGSGTASPYDAGAKRGRQRGKDR